MKMYISSADFMTRNTLKRVEVAGPVYDESIIDRILHMLNIMLKDNVKARIMGSDGNYYHKGIKEGEESINSQEYFYDEAIKASR